MKKTILYLLLTASLTSCAQNKAKIADHSISDLYKEVKFIEQKISYRAGIQIGGCNFTFLINDVPVVQYFEDVSGTFNTSTPINNAILKTGKQTFKLILYPGFKNHRRLTGLAENILAKITIEGLKYEGEGVKTIVYPFTILEIPGQDKPFVDAGKQTAVFEGTFNAKVPYELVGWSKSKDLSKENPDLLLKEVLASYQKYIEILKNKDEFALAKLIYKKEKDYAQALFLDKNATAYQWETYTREIKGPERRILPIEKYKMKIYGNGRLVTLERTDYPNIGEPTLRAEYGPEGDEQVVGLYYHLHKPEGSNTLELIY